MTKEYIEQELNRLVKCEKAMGVPLRNWAWRELWQDSINKHRAFLLGALPPKQAEDMREQFNRANRIAVEFLKTGFKNH